jgi:hypothetical protein
MIIGWGLFWRFWNQAPPPDEPVPRATARPEPVVPDRSEVFETVTDRTRTAFRDNAAYAYLLEKARGLTPSELARKSRRDVFLTHLWERPENYRGVPVHLFGTAKKVLYYESKLSKTGWLYETWIYTPEASKFPYCCVSEDVPEGLPIGVKVSERVVFNGYFLKIMKYDASDVARGAPLLIGKLGWEPHAATTPAPAAARGVESNPLLYWSLVVLGAMFAISLLRWVSQLFHVIAPTPDHGREYHSSTPDLRDDELDAWVHSVKDENPDELDLSG